MACATLMPSHWRGLCQCPAIAPAHRPSLNSCRRLARSQRVAAKPEQEPLPEQPVNIRDEGLLERPAPKPPQGVSFPKIEPQPRPLYFGFVENAERLNSRAAMVGFIALLILEGVTNRGILDMVGIRVGGGLGLEL